MNPSRYLRDIPHESHIDRVEPHGSAVKWRSTEGAGATVTQGLPATQRRGRELPMPSAA